MVPSCTCPAPVTIRVFPRTSPMITSPRGVENSNDPCTADRRIVCAATFGAADLGIGMVSFEAAAFTDREDAAFVPSMRT